ncbi:MAG: class I SAM-dependent methyltransferase [Bacteroidota bacterium]
MAYYDKIATKWHRYTGYNGGAFKELILNEKVIAKVPEIQSKTLLEIGIGNGYFMPVLMKKKSGQVPDKVFLTDISTSNLEIAMKHFKVPNSIYKRLDLYKPFEFEDHSIDVLISNMVFNEIKTSGLQNAIREINRVLKPGGSFVISVLHPEFIRKQIDRGVIKGNLMVSGNGLKIPTVARNLEDYTAAFKGTNLTFEKEDVFGNQKLYNKKPKLKALKDLPIGLIISGVKDE